MKDRRQKGTRGSVRIFEKVMYKVPGAKGEDKGDVRCEEGRYLGVLDGSSEVLIGLEEGIVEVRDVLKFGYFTRSWDAESVKTVVGTPRRLNPDLKEDKL